MAFASSNSTRHSGDLAGISRPMVQALFAASCLLSVVSWYTTFEGMRLYLSVWFSLLASIGLQTALVLVAWLIGFSFTATRHTARRALLIGVYIVTAIVSIAFSYTSLYTWFSARERPATIERKLYDALNDSAGQTQKLLTAAIDEQQKHVVALQEMTVAEKTHGSISRAQDADPYLAQVRAAVAREAQTYAANYKEGAGAGVRYSAFDRYTKLAEQSFARMQQAQTALAMFVSNTKPLDSTEKQLQSYRLAYDRVPWSDVEQTLHAGQIAKPAVPAYSDFVDRTVSGQEDLLVAFQELFTAPTARHVFALMLAGFIDVVVFLLAFATGPYFFGSLEHRWISAGAALEGLDHQIFTRDFLRKLTPGPRGMARVDASMLTPGEQQLCLLWAAKKLAVVVEEDGRLYYMLEQGIHEQLLESLASQQFPLRASAAASR
ncbi:MAG TPA: hypothetical protein VFW44_02760 [Bryobacteraceae bacterium]|nr:hypothetical protein [Bryobacteraceae bacterium]